MIHLPALCPTWASRWDRTLCHRGGLAGARCCGPGSQWDCSEDHNNQYADDYDEDGIEDDFDNCPFVVNESQVDQDAEYVVTVIAEGDPPADRWCSAAPARRAPASGAWLLLALGLGLALLRRRR